MTNRSTLRRGRGIAALIPSGPPGLDGQPEDVANTVRPRRTPGQRGGDFGTEVNLGVQDEPNQGDRTSQQQAELATIDLRPHAVAGLSLVTAKVSSIRPNPQQPRTEFDPDALEQLAVSLKEVGFLQPVVVRPAKSGYELVAGERRWRASQIAGFTEIPAIVRTTDDDVLLRDALLENLQRVQLNPIEEAAAYEQLLQDFGGTHEELAAKLGRSRPQVSNTLRLLKLSAPVQRRVAAGVLSAGHARALVSLDDPELAEQLASKVVAEGISVRGLEELVSLSDGTKRKKRTKTPAIANPLVEYQTVADRLSDSLDTRVRVTGSAKRGRIVIDFAGIEDLARIIDLFEQSNQ